MINDDKLLWIDDADAWNCIFGVIYLILLLSGTKSNLQQNEKKYPNKKVMESDESSKFGLVKSVILYGIDKNMKSSQFATTL